ncbi:MAG: MFS transporter [Flavobacteriales bacterium]|nr:MFS transporter [Flavobacteriales bacterium]
MDRRLLILWLTIFIDLLGFTLFIPVMPYFGERVGASEFMVILSSAVFSLLVFLCSPIWGSASDRFGRRPVILASVIISAVSYVVFAHADNVIWLFVSRILTGMGSGNIAAAQAYVSDISEPKDRAKRIGLVVGAAWGIAFAAGPVLGGYIFHHLGGIQSVGYFAVGLCLLNLLGVLFVLPESLKEKDHARTINFKPVASTFASLKDQRFRDIFIIGFVYITAFSMMNVSISFFWKDRYALDVDQVGMLMAIVGVMSAISQGALVGVFQKLWGERRMMINGAVLVGLGLAAIPFVPLGLRASVPLGADGQPIHQDLDLLFVLYSMVPMIMLSVGNACLNPSLVSILSRQAGPHEQGEVMGQNMGFGSLGRVLGPTLSSFLYPLGMGLPFWVGGAIMLGTLALVFHYLRTSYKPLVGASDRPA